VLFAGLFVCHACGQTGPWTWLDKRLKDKSRGESVAPVFPVPESGKSQGEPVPDEIMARCQPASMVSDKDLKECLGQLHLKVILLDCPRDYCSIYLTTSVDKIIFN